MPRTRSVSSRCRSKNSSDNFRFGIEEEYFLVDADTKAIATIAPESLFKAVKTLTRGRGKREFLQQQVEVATEPHVDIPKARVELPVAPG